MINPAITMRTQAFLVLTLFKLILLVPVSSADNQTHSTLLSDLTTSPEALGEKLGSTDSSMTTEDKSRQQNDTTDAPTSPSLPTSTSPTTSQLNKFSSSTLTKNTTPQTPNSTRSKSIIYAIASIMVLMLFVGCFLIMRCRHSGQDSSVPRLLLGVRERLRTVISALEDQIRPGANRGRQDDDTEGRQREEGQMRGHRGEGASFGVRNKEVAEHKEEDSSTSDDFSSMEEYNLRETALSRQEEEERKQSGNEDGEETSSASEEDQCDLEGESSGDKKDGSEEIVLVSSPQEDDSKADLSDVTVL